MIGPAGVTFAAPDGVPAVAPVAYTVQLVQDWTRGRVHARASRAFLLDTDPPTFCGRPVREFWKRKGIWLEKLTLVANADPVEAVDRVTCPICKTAIAVELEVGP